MVGLWEMGVVFFTFSLVTFCFSLFTLYTMKLCFFTFSDALCVLFFPFFVIIQFASRCTLFKGGEDEGEVAESWMGCAHDLSHLASLSLSLLFYSRFFPFSEIKKLDWWCKRQV